jgi:BclB C-terminal domain-containing protein
MTNLLDDIAETVSLLGFGSSAIGVTLIDGNTVSLSGTPGLLLNMAFSMPRDGTLTGITAYFSLVTGVLGLLLDESIVTIIAQVYTSPTPDNTFTAVPGAFVVLTPTLTGTLFTGAISFGSNTELSIPLTAQTRVLVVFSITSEDLAIIVPVTGYASAGLTIV